MSGCAGSAAPMGVQFPGCGAVRVAEIVILVGTPEHDGAGTCRLEDCRDLCSLGQENWCGEPQLPTVGTELERRQIAGCNVLGAEDGGVRRTLGDPANL